MASTSATRSTTRRRPPRNNSPLQLGEWVWPSLWFILVAGSGIFCGWALLWLTRIPPLPDCEQITPFHSSRDMLYCAKSQARTGDPNSLVQSVLLTMNWPKTDANYEESQEILKDSSEQILVLANRWAQAGKVDDAVKLAGEIPINTPLRQSAQALIYEWRQDWSQGQAIEAQLKQALAEQNWEGAREQMQAFRSLNNAYWLSTRPNYWIHQIQVEQQAWDQLLVARDLAAPGGPEDLKAAITLARGIDLRSQVWLTAEQDVDRWSQTLLGMALAQWNGGSPGTSLTLASVVPPGPGLPAEAMDLLRLSQAQRLATQTGQDNPGQPPHYGHALNLMEAIAAVGHITDDSTFATVSQPNLENWQAQLSDLQRLKFGAMVARLGQRVSYQWAINQAQQVEQGRPRRIHGQTLVANWRANVERIEDRPTLLKARLTAQPGTIPALQAAIAQASEVELGRALRVEAQTLVAGWQQEIQVIEDRPILDAAVAQAEAGNLREAIAEASKIQPNRALHTRAQTLIEDWTTAIQITEDRPILDRAQNLARAGSLTAAINLASQIGPGRALHSEARQAIALWRTERSYIWSIWEAEGRSVPGGSDSNRTDTE